MVGSMGAVKIKTVWCHYPVFLDSDKVHDGAELFSASEENGQGKQPDGITMPCRRTAHEEDVENHTGRRDDESLEYYSQNKSGQASC